jgi:uridine kinase
MNKIILISVAGDSAAGNTQRQVQIIGIANCSKLNRFKWPK